MATLLLLDGVSWGNLQQSSGFLSSFQRSAEHFSPPPPSHCCNRPCEPSISTTRCASSSELLDRLDPPLPRIPSHSSIKYSRVSQPRPQLILETRPTLLQVNPDERSDALAQPSSPGDRDTSRQMTITGDGQEVDMRRSYRVSPSYLSVSQSRRAMTSAAVLQAASTPLKMKDMKGPVSFYVGFTAIVLGLVAVLQKGGLLGNVNAPTWICTSCNGYGRRVCNLCNGSGTISWEGKLKHTDVCPSCLGTLVRKCSDCGGYRMKNEDPLFLQQLSKLSASKA